MCKLLQLQRARKLPVDTSLYQRVVVRRRHLWQDALHRFKCGMDFTKYIRVAFVGEPAVDEGGPLREFLHLLMGSIATNNALFSGREECRVPASNLPELDKNTYVHVGEMIAVCLVHGGPAPAFFAPSVADYILHGMQKVRGMVSEVPSLEMGDKLQEVSCHGDTGSVLQLAHSLRHYNKHRSLLIF